MSKIGEPERRAQKRILRLLTDPATGLGWTYLGDRHTRAGNANIEEAELRSWLLKRHDAGVVAKAIAELKRAARMDGIKLYEANQVAYEILRYGVQVVPGPGEAPVTVMFINWENPSANDLGVAEEVAIAGQDPTTYDKRPDLVLYVNGIALGVIELKKSTIGVAEGIRQTLDNQKPKFIRHFFTTVQLTFAGNDSEGLRYAPILTPQPYWLAWKEESTITNRLDRDVLQMMAPAQFLELIHDFTLFDGGTKKIARPNQYFAVKAAQDRVQAHESGIIWQTQGSGKSLIMVMLARWINEHFPDSRILVVTDRKELDNQIKDGFLDTGTKVRRAKSGADLMAALANAEDRVVCSLIHKFGAREERDLDGLIAEVRRSTAGAPAGEFFVFIDECHRTQSGKLARAMRQVLPNAMLIGFTGTPLLRSDKATSHEAFGPYIGTPYRFDEAVSDEVVLDLRYEARDIDQRIGWPEKIDQWFEANTKGLTEVAKATLKQRWGTLQRVLSSRGRLEKIVTDIIFDMSILPRLASGRGNAMLVAGSIPEACRLFELFRNSGTPIADKCAIVTSYKRAAAEITGEETGMGETERQYVHKVYEDLLGQDDEEEYERSALEAFRNKPAQMKLLIVVSRLLTGFDAPSASYIYIDKQMRDHSLFQAICRVNRLDGDDKDYGFIIDYKDLFKSIERAVGDYTTEAFDNFDHEDVAGLITDRAEKASEDFDTAREAWFALLEPVEPPKGDDEVYAYFSTLDGVTDPVPSEEKARRRQTLYRLAGAFARAFAGIAEDPTSSGVTESEIYLYRKEVEDALNLRDAIRLHSGDAIDLKLYEPAMRALIDTFIQADDSKTISTLDDVSLIDLIDGAPSSIEDGLPAALGRNRDNVAEAIANNVRRLIIEETPVNPRFYETMSGLLTDLVKKRRDDAIDYAAYLARIAEMIRQSKAGHGMSYPPSIASSGRKALFDNLDKDEKLTLAVDKAIRDTAQAGWRGNRMKTRMVMRCLVEVLGSDDEADRILEIVRAHDEY